MFTISLSGTALQRALTTIVFALIYSLHASATEVAHHHAARADSHGPIGVMGEHIHKKGEWMLSYRYHYMDMEENRDGDKRISDSEIFARGYRVAPKSMTMEMHMVGVMYAPSDKLTLMAMVPLIATEMDHRTAMGGEFTTRTDGLGDTSLSALYRLAGDQHSNWILNMGVSLPTGSIDEEDKTGMSMGRDVQLPYPMQLGSGSVELLPGMTYTALHDAWSWGAQAGATIPLEDNDNGYRLGNSYRATAWYAKPLADNVSVSLRANYKYWQDIDGRDKKLSPMTVTMVPTADPDLRAGKQLELGAGVNWLLPGKSTQRLALELIKPVYQDLQGPQLETDLTVVLGWQLSH